MFTRVELGRIAGIPIYLDMMFVLVLIVFGYRYFTSGNMQLMSAGLIIIAGLLLSILLHELGHALMGRVFGIGTREIELTGLGGVARFATALPKSVLIRTCVFLAGPAVNLALWKGLGWLQIASIDLGKPVLFSVLGTISIANLYLLAFNLLPAYPLDGGHTLDAWLNAIMGPVWSTRIVAVLGLVVCAGLVYMAFPLNIWLLLLAFVLFQVNWTAFDSVSGGGRRRG